VTGFARTVLGDVDVDRLGVVLAHEHLIIDSPIVAETMARIHLPSVDEAVAESRLMADAGIGTVVDAMPAGSGGQADRLVEVCRATRLRVIATTGMHTSRYYAPDDRYLLDPPEDLARAFTHAITGPPPRAGLIKVATMGPTPTDQERRLFEAAAITVADTGVPVLTHCENGEGGMTQIEMMSTLGIPLTRAALSHTDKVSDRGYHHGLLETGVLLCLDQGLRETESTATLAADLVESGYGDQLLLGTDAARRTLWSSLGGGPGPAWINTGFRAVLADHGLGDSQIDRLFRDNPARWLAMSG
jgi:phosphotriesterase-related protein